MQVVTIMSPRRDYGETKQNQMTIPVSINNKGKEAKPGRKVKQLVTAPYAMERKRKSDRR